MGRAGAQGRDACCVPPHRLRHLCPRRDGSPRGPPPQFAAKARPVLKPPSLQALPFPAKSGFAVPLPSSQAERNSAAEPQIPVRFAGQLLSAAALSTAEPCEAPATLLCRAVCAAAASQPGEPPAHPASPSWRRAQHPVGWLACLDTELSFQCLPGDSCCSTAACCCLSWQTAGGCPGCSPPVSCLSGP